MTERTVLLAKRAEREIGAAIAWWRENRTAAPHTLELELEAALRTILEHPQAGRRVFDARVTEVRRLSLNRSRYYLFYRTGAKQITVLSLRHQSRLPQPPLR